MMADLLLLLPTYKKRKQEDKIEEAGWQDRRDSLDCDRWLSFRCKIAVLLGVSLSLLCC